MSEAEKYFWIGVAALVLLLDLRAFISLFRTRKTIGEKAAWVIGLFFFPAFGLVIWGIAGGEKD
ncbi:PLD nuclease N-terminal domain-containing protein [Pseudomonas akapageensis]|uniref:PLD nuclease N-terminal domain-containing protein n=1 Tax=Pseudomonas akapageensis TaxID=2609961 RepID=UPI00140DABE0|nr:PLD nuclease N-terminal domain-containing protein [Pseudomonas akapageensis]